MCLVELNRDVAKLTDGPLPSLHFATHDDAASNPPGPLDEHSIDESARRAPSKLRETPKVCVVIYLERAIPPQAFA
jgi:hypothetical protein